MFEVVMMFFKSGIADAIGVVFGAHGPKGSMGIFSYAGSADI